VRLPIPPPPQVYGNFEFTTGSAEARGSGCGSGSRLGRQRARKLNGFHRPVSCLRLGHRGSGVQIAPPRPKKSIRYEPPRKTRQLNLVELRGFYSHKFNYSLREGRAKGPSLAAFTEGDPLLLRQAVARQNAIYLRELL
jgi:hypothetical protein